MNSLKKETKTTRALKKEIDSVERAIERMRGLLPYYGEAVRKVPIHFVLHPLTEPTSSIRNAIARNRAYLEIISVHHHQVTAYIDAELWRLDAIDTATRLLDNSHATMEVHELHFS